MVFSYGACSDNFRSSFLSTVCKSIIIKNEYPFKLLVYLLVLEGNGKPQGKANET